MLPRVQLGATSLPSAPSIPSLLGKWPGYGQLRQERERGQQSSAHLDTQASLPFLPLTCCRCPSLPRSCTLYCCVRRVCTYSTSSSPTHALSVWPLSPLFETGQWPQDREQSTPKWTKSKPRLFGGYYFLLGGMINCQQESNQIFLKLNQTVEVHVV